MSSPPVGHDVLALGASAGGIEALTRVVSGLPADLPASVFIVQHTDAGYTSRLPDVLARHSRLPVRHGLHGEAIEPGRIYVAPSDNHLMLRPGYLHVARGPKENGHRPSVDALFRSAATSYGPRVVAAVLTGYLDCGTAGLLSVKARGGVAVVQDPASAEAPGMPTSALRHVAVDHVAALDDMAALLTRVAREPAGPGPAGARSALLEMEGAEPGAAVSLVCPLCQGSLTESEVRGFQVFRCHVGHAFSLESIAQEQADSVERALWAAVRALDESAALGGRLAATAAGPMRGRFQEKQETLRRHADVIRQILLRGEGLTHDDAAALEAPDVGAPPAPDDE